MASQSTPALPAGNQLKIWFTGVKEYIDDLKTEMRRVTWPTRVQVQATTAVVVISVFMFAAYFALIDLVLGGSINKLFHYFITVRK
jgi:preprotein translocase subunit SecE